MSLFQVFSLSIVGCLFVASVIAMWRGWGTLRESLTWALVWLAAAVAIIWPGVTKMIANVLGIGRGADLVFYCAVVVMMIGFLMVYVRLRRIRRELTLLVRHLAIRDAVITPSPQEPRTESSSDQPPDEPSH